MNRSKYEPMFIVIFYSIMGLAIALFLGVIKHYIYDCSIIDVIEGPLFISIVAILFGLAYCEISFYIKNLWLGAIIFGILTSNLFIFSLPISSLIFDGKIGSLPPLNLYLLLILFMSFILGLIYLTAKKKDVV